MKAMPFDRKRAASMERPSLHNATMAPVDLMTLLGVIVSIIALGVTMLGLGLTVGLAL
jgi:hypothetical protein